MRYFRETFPAAKSAFFMSENRVDKREEEIKNFENIWCHLPKKFVRQHGIWITINTIYRATQLHSPALIF